MLDNTPTQQTQFSLTDNNQINEVKKLIGDSGIFENEESDLDTFPYQLDLYLNGFKEKRLCELENYLKTYMEFFKSTTEQLKILGISEDQFSDFEDTVRREVYLNKVPQIFGFPFIDDDDFKESVKNVSEL